MKLSERINDYLEAGLGSPTLFNLLDDCYALARRVEGAAVGKVDMACGTDAVVVDRLPAAAIYALNKQRVRLVPEVGA